MKRISSLLFSMTTTGILLVVFAASIAYATFIENDFGTITAKIMVYNAKWFEVLLVLLVINLTGSIIVNKLITGKKWSMFLFHASFILIFLGAAITRFTGTEGNMHIREGQSTDETLSEDSYMNITVSEGSDTVNLMKKVKFSAQTGNRFKESIWLRNTNIEVENIGFMPKATRTIIPDENGTPAVVLVALSAQNERLEFILQKGEERNFNNIVFSFEYQTEETSVLFKEKDSGIVVTALNNSFSAGNSVENKTVLPLMEEFSMNNKTIYQVGHINFVLKQYMPKAKPVLQQASGAEAANAPDAVQVKVTTGGKSATIDALGSKGMPGQPVSVILDSLKVTISYGSVLKKLPFSLYLNDFQIDRYPGSNSPSSFASEVTLIDKNENLEHPFRIFMNNILKYKGYRFFQSSYDTDEKGTILAVNYDSWGTTVTYTGYLLMAVGMIFTFFNRNSRFRRLISALDKLKVNRSVQVIMILAVFTIFGTALPASAQGLVSENHLKYFGELLVQSNDGRIEPVNSVASEILRKVYKKDNFQGMSAVEVFLDMNTDPARWADIPVIEVGRKEIRSMLGTSNDYVSYNMVMQGGYKLANQVKEAYGKKPGARSKTDKEILTIDERINVIYLVLSGSMMKIFPIPEDPNHTWIFLSGSEQKLPAENREFAIRTYSNYLAAVNNAKKSGNWAEADKLLAELKSNQVKYGSLVIPSGTKIKLENFYVNYNIFSKLAKLYLIVGLILLISVFINIFRPNVRIEKILKTGAIGVLVLFILHTAGLGIRWYISGHAPWSNGYESMIFISWATCLAGLVFARKSNMALAVTTILSALTLLIAGLSWMNPEITNLVPVLKSYWLIIHVAIVTSSYGFLGIGAILGLMNLILIVLRNDSNSEKVSFTLKELTYIIEIALIIGLFMLSIGSFIGGVWANESWGRYWGWDPKETWAMVTILVYSFIVHMHKIPGFKGYFQVSAAALLGFGSVLMTYFGVNYYLSGLHSYASGDSIPIPAGVYIGVLVVIILIVAAFFANRFSAKDTEPDELTELE